MEKLLRELEKWSEKYNYNFQFWGKGQNNVFIYKDEVEIQSFGGRESIEDVLRDTVNYIHRINRVK